MFIGSLNKKLWLFSFFPGFFLRFISAGSIVASKMYTFQCIRYRISNQVSSENKFCQKNLTTICTLHYIFSNPNKLVVCFHTVCPCCTKRLGGRGVWREVMEFRLTFFIQIIYIFI